MFYLISLIVLLIALLFFKDIIKLALDMNPKDDKEFFKNIAIIISLVAGVFAYSYFMGKNEVFGFLVALGILLVVGVIYMFSSKDDKEPEDDKNDNIKKEFIDHM